MTTIVVCVDILESYNTKFNNTTAITYEVIINNFELLLI